MKKEIPQDITFKSYIILIISIVFLISGYLIMSFGDRTVSIILLMIAYIVLIPISLFIKAKKKSKHE